MGYAQKDTELDNYMNRIEQNDRRKESVETRALELMSYGNEYYPFDPKNFAEAVGEMTEIFWIVAASWAHTSDKTNEEDRGERYAASVLGNEFIKNANVYWLKQALAKAESEIE